PSDARAALTTAVGDMVDAEVSTAVGRMLIDATTHGVVGDGTTNVAAPLNTLISDTSAAGGGVIVLPVGTYICIGGVNGASNVTLRGADRDGTIIRKSGSNSTWINTGSSSNFRIENLTIDGNGGVTTRGITFSSGSMDCTLDRVTVRNMPAFATDSMNTAEGVTITGCRFTGCRTGVRVSGAVSRVLVDGCEFSDWMDSAVYVSGTASSATSDVTISNNVVAPHLDGTPAAMTRQPIRFHGDDS